MAKDDVDVEAEQEPAVRAKLLAERMHQLRLTGRILIALGGFLIAVADNVSGMQPMGPGVEPNPGEWFGQ